MSNSLAPYITLVGSGCFEVRRNGGPVGMKVELSFFRHKPRKKRWGRADVINLHLPRQNWGVSMRGCCVYLAESQAASLNGSTQSSNRQKYSEP